MTTVTCNYYYYHYYCRMRETSYWKLQFIVQSKSLECSLPVLLLSTTTAPFVKGMLMSPHKKMNSSDLNSNLRSNNEYHHLVNPVESSVCLPSTTQTCFSSSPPGTQLQDIMCPYGTFMSQLNIRYGIEVDFISIKCSNGDFGGAFGGTGGTRDAINRNKLSFRRIFTLW
jgi:hypothetical protein